MDKLPIQYISWNYGTSPHFNYKLWCYERLHLIRLKSGAGLLKTTSEMRTLGLCE
jgi:hypothetical protein